MYKPLQPILLYLTIFCCLLTASVAEAKVKSATGQLRLIATLNGKPAFRPVLWKLTPGTGNRRSGVRFLKRHTATIDLEPGNYRVSVSMGNKTRTHHVTIKESTRQLLVVKLD